MRRGQRLTTGLVTLGALVGALLVTSAPALAAAPETPEVTVEAHVPFPPSPSTEAVFHGILNPAASEPVAAGTYEFLYKKSPTECTGGSKAPASSPAISKGNPHEEVSETVTGLEAGKTYTVCLLARNGTKIGENEVVSAPPVTFTTATPAEKPKTEPATGETSSTATLHGVLNPLGTATTKAGWYFAYNTETTCTGAKEQQTAHEAELEGDALLVPPLGNPPVEIGGLEPNQKYKVCLVATNDAGEPTPGNEVSFETSPLPPAIASETASSVKSTVTTLEAQINPNNEKTKYTFEYSTSENGAGVLTGTIVKQAGAAELEGYPEKLASVALTGLEAGKTYFYRVVAENKKSEEESKPVVLPVQSFTTVPMPAIASAAGPQTATTRTFSGSFKPLNPTVATQYYFAYNIGSSCAGGSTTATVEAGTSAVPGTEVVVKPTEVEELQPFQEYTVCLVVSNAYGTVEGPSQEFSTFAAPPKILSEGVSGVTPTEATLEAKINPNNREVTYAFEYATNPALTGATKVAGAGPLSPRFNAEGDTATIPALTGLKVRETYYYRVIAENTEVSGETIDGPIQSFTPQGEPLVNTGAVLAIGQSSANVTGTVNPAGLETHYYYQYGPTTEYGQRTSAGEAGIDVGAGTSAVEAPAVLVPLTPGVTYHYRLVAWNEDGTSYGQDETFTAVAGQSPLAVTGPASGVAVSEATISGTINPQGKETSYRFEYGTNTEYGTQAFGTVLPEQGEQTVALSLRGLDPSTTYHYRLVVTSPAGTSEGADQTFTTPGILDPLVFPAVAPLIANPAIAFPTGSLANTGTTTKTLTKAQKLAKALKACRAKRGKNRSSCERAARKNFGPVKKKATKNK